MEHYEEVALTKICEAYAQSRTHLNGTLSVITVLHGSAMFVNAMVSEHKEPAEDSGGQG